MESRTQAVQLFRRSRRVCLGLRWFACFVFAICFSPAISAQQPEQNTEWKSSSPRPAPIVPVQATTAAASETLTLDEAVRYGLANNPQLASIRQQYGIAAAGVVIAKTYPFNPILQTGAAAAMGPPSAGVTNSVFTTARVAIEAEVRGQRAFRQQAAFAALTRTEWEVASQEITFAINTVRAFDGLVYRQAKLALTEEFVKLNQKASEQVKELVDRGTLRSADILLARAEVNSMRSQIGLNRTALLTARHDFARSLGKADLTAVPVGTLDRPAPTSETDRLLEAALEHRPDLFARERAIAEADARLKLQIADRLGNLTIGPTYELNETRVNMVGLAIDAPIPVFNRKRGEVKQREAERLQAILNLRQTEMEIRQDVVTAAPRVAEARAWLNNYQQEILPDLRKSLNEMDKLFQQGQAGVDILRVLDVRRKLLQAQDGYLDAFAGLFLRQLADLGLALGDPARRWGSIRRLESRRQNEILVDSKVWRWFCRRPTIACASGFPARRGQPASGWKARRTGEPSDVTGNLTGQHHDSIWEVSTFRAHCFRCRAVGHFRLQKAFRGRQKGRCGSARRRPNCRRGSSQAPTDVSKSSGRSSPSPRSSRA